MDWQRTLGVLTIAGFSSGLLVAPAAAAEISTAKDMTAVIALNGKPCGEVTAVKQQGPNDYLATCKDGNRYRVFVNADGRVIVQKQ
jgi:hypothetical protein